jgi:membrane associated rhomboid family serine protease
MLPLYDDQPRYSTPYVTYFLIALNLLIYLFEASLSRRDLHIFVGEFAVIPARVTALLAGHSLGLALLPVFTSMFLHASWMHVIGNMWFLHIFGDNVEDHLGHFKYLLFYLAAGLCAMSTQILVDPHSRVPTLGASGAIAGVLGAYFVLYPASRVLTWFFVFVMYIPAWIILGYWFVLQFLSGAATTLAYEGHNVGGVAFWAHVGGFIAGVLMIKIFRERPRRSPYYAWR